MAYPMVSSCPSVHAYWVLSYWAISITSRPTIISMPYPPICISVLKASRIIYWIIRLIVKDFPTYVSTTWTYPQVLVICFGGGGGGIIFFLDEGWVWSKVDTTSFLFRAHPLVVMLLGFFFCTNRAFTPWTGASMDSTTFPLPLGYSTRVSSFFSINKGSITYREN